MKRLNMTETETKLENEKLARVRQIIQFMIGEGVA